MAQRGFAHSGNHENPRPRNHETKNVTSNRQSTCGFQHFVFSYFRVFAMRLSLCGFAASRRCATTRPNKLSLGNTSPSHRRLAIQALPPRAFTLLEVILAMGLAVVVLGLVGVGIHVHLAVAAKSRDQVEEAQLARVLLQRIADDLRNAVPFQPPPSSSSGTAGQSGASAASSGTPDLNSTTPLSGGIYGTAQAIQIETVRRPRATLASLQAAASDPSQPARLSDIRVVSYSLGAPISADMSQNSPASTSGTGLYRHEQDRAEFFYASQNGQVDQSDPATELLAPEVVDFHLTYYGGTAGTTSTGATSGGTTSTAAASGGTSTNGAASGGTSNADTTTNGATSDDQWDSTQAGMLPVAVRISISLRHESPKSLLSLLGNEKRPPVAYSLLVNLPNAGVDAVSAAAQQATPPPTSTAFVSITPQGGRGHEAGNGERGRGERGEGERGREAGNGERGRGERGEGERGGERGRGERGRGERGRGEGRGGNGPGQQSSQGGG
jgi:type II secretory pathway pseudopilin PulG